MSYDATTLSTTLSLSSSIIDDTSRPSSTRPEAGWGSPSPVPDSFPPTSLATVPTPIHSVTVSLYAHTLRDDFPDACNIKKLSDYLRSPAFTLSIDFFLNIGSPLCPPMCIPQKLPPLPHEHQSFPLTSTNPTLPSHLRSILGGRGIASHGDVPTWYAGVFRRH